MSKPCGHRGSLLPKQQWFVRIDDIDDSELEFMGWYRVAQDAEFSMYQRPYDGQQQVVSNEPPRFLVLDDYNDAQSISRERIIAGPQNMH